MAQLMDLLESYHGTKQTFCFGIVSEDPDLDDLEVGLLDLLAGYSSSTLLCLQSKNDLPLSDSTKTHRMTARLTSAQSYAGCSVMK